MAYSSKSAFILLSLVLSIYIMRNTDLSPGSVFSHAVRSLATSTPTVSFCADVDINASFSSQQIEQAEAALESVKMLRGGNKLLDFLLASQKDEMEYIKPLIPVVVPWAVMLIISLLCCFSLCCNWCYLHGCCKNNRICSCCKAPKHQTKTKLFVTLSSVFLIFTLGAAIAGVIFSRQVAPGIRRTFCSALNLGGELVYGVSEKKWMGLDPAIVTLDALLTDFDSAIASVGRATDTTTVSSECQAGKDMIADFVTEHQGKTAPRAAADQLGQFYQPAYIANIGPETTNTSYAGMIYTEFHLYNATVVGGQASVDSSVGEIKNQQSTIKNAIQDGRGVAVDINKNAKTILGDIRDNQDVVEGAITGLNIGLLVFFLVFLVLAVLSIFAIILLLKFRVKIFSKCLHLSWCLFIVLTLLGFILSGVFYTGSVAAVEGCDSVNALLDKEELFVNVSRAYLPVNYWNVPDYLSSCLFNGNLLTKLNLTNNLLSFGTIEIALETVKKLIPFNRSSTPTSLSIATQISTLTLMKYGLIPDSTTTTDDLVALNAATNSASNSCTNIKDTWLLNSTNCTTSQGVIFDGRSNTYDMPNPTCIGFDAWGNTQDVNLRYTNQFDSCSNRGGMTTLNYVKGTVSGFKNNRVTVDLILDQLLSAGTDNLNKINGQFNTFMGAIVNVADELEDIETKLQSIEALLIDPTSGLVNNFDCTFIAGSTQLVVKSMCVEFISGAFFTGVLLIIMSFMSLLSAMWLFILLKRVNLPKYEMAKTTSPSV